jgi:hypothetical protein
LALQREDSAGLRGPLSGVKRDVVCARRICAEQTECSNAGGKVSLISLLGTGESTRGLDYLRVKHGNEKFNIKVFFSAFCFISLST